MESIRGYDKWRTAAPDEPEAVHCDDCGEEMEVKQDLDGTTYTKCNFAHCPAKFEGVAAEMANELVEAREEVKRLTANVKRLEMKWIS